MSKRSFGTLSDGTAVSLYTIANSKGMEAAVSDYGANVVSIFVEDKDGNKRDVILGFDDAADYEASGSYFGATVGRNCNRISDARIVIDKTVYELEKNDRGNNLHSGSKGLSRVMWNVKEQLADRITFSYYSPDLEEGYPGNATIEVTFEVTENNDFSISYYAVSDKKTIFNMTSHCYYNLNGHASGTILDQELKIKAYGYTPVKNELSIPTGEVLALEGTPFDFREAKPIGRDIHADHEQIKYSKGYDHNFAIAKETDGMETVACAYAKESGIQMEVITDAIAIQLYTANAMFEVGKENTAYPDYGAFCLETQYFPNAVNEPNFVTPLFDAGEPYKSKTMYHFSIR